MRFASRRRRGAVPSGAMPEKAVMPPGAPVSIVTESLKSGLVATKPHVPLSVR